MYDLIVCVNQSDNPSVLITSLLLLWLRVTSSLNLWLKFNFYVPLINWYLSLYFDTTLLVDECEDLLWINHVLTTSRSSLICLLLIHLGTQQYEGTVVTQEVSAKSRLDEVGFMTCYTNPRLAPSTTALVRLYNVPLTRVREVHSIVCSACSLWVIWALLKLYLAGWRT